MTSDAKTDDAKEAFDPTDWMPEIESIANTQFALALKKFDGAIQSQQLMCKINYRFTGPQGLHHTCIGCNLDDQTEQVSKFLSLAATNAANLDVHHRFSMYAMLLNGIWERIRDIFEIIGVPEGYLKRHFEPFLLARRWANFFKHPKVFGWFVHHPVYTISGSKHQLDGFVDTKKFKFVDGDFLNEYYSADCKKNAHKLRGEFTGFERSVVVLIPDIPTLTDGITDCLARFVSIITENPIYVEMLNDHSTIENYFLDEGCPIPD